MHISQSLHCIAQLPAPDISLQLRTADCTSQHRHSMCTNLMAHLSSCPCVVVSLSDWLQPFCQPRSYWQDQLLCMSVAFALSQCVNKIAQLDPCPLSVSVSEAVGCLQDKLLSMAVANHVLWPLAKFVNAKLVPKQHQPVANKVVQVSHAASLIIMIITINSLSSAGRVLSLYSSSKSDFFPPKGFRRSTLPSADHTLN